MKTLATFTRDRITGTKEGFIGLLVAVVVMVTSQLPAAQPAWKLTPNECQPLGISVTIRQEAGALHHGVTVTIDKSAELLKEPLSARVSSKGFDIPVVIAKDQKGNRIIRFSMTHEMLGQGKIWLESQRWSENGAYIDLKAFLASVEEEK